MVVAGDSTDQLGAARVGEEHEPEGVGPDSEEAGPGFEEVELEPEEAVA